MSDGSSSSLRELVKDAVNKSMYVTAGFIAEQLIRAPDATISDLIIFAKCFYLQNQPRRCLAALEQRGLLSANNTQLLSETLLSVTPIQTQNDDENAILTGSNLIDLVSAFHLAARCLFSLEEYEDCVTLLGPLVALDVDRESDNDCNVFIGCDSAVQRAIDLFEHQNMDQNRENNGLAPSSSSGASSSCGGAMQINPMSGIYNTIGQCYDQLDNRPRAVKALIAALTVDSACTEAAEYLTVHGLLSTQERRVLVRDKLDLSKGRAWLKGYYMFTLLGESPTATNPLETDSPPRALQSGTGGIQHLYEPSSAEWMARNAEHLYDHMQPEEAYRLARQAYTSDPFDSRGLLVYIACLLELKMKTELFYLGHELSRTYPKMAVSWYAVGCYYLCCGKHEAAQKHLQRATKIDKRFAKAWVALGQSLSAQEESEHAIAAYRAACRLLPGDHRPMVLMAKELVRTNYLSLALHLLAGAVHIFPKDPVVHNEIGVIYIRLHRLEEALGHFFQAVTSLDAISQTGTKSGSGCSRITEEIFSNYATALRKSDRLEEALSWYNRCLGLSPSDANTHASIAFTLHLLRRYDSAISSYHRALALQPTFTFCIDMLNRAMIDSNSSNSNSGDSGEFLGTNNFTSKSYYNSDSENHGNENHGNEGDADGLSFMLGEADSVSFLN